MHLFLESGFKPALALNEHLVTDFAFMETKVSNFTLHEDNPSPISSQVHDFHSETSPIENHQQPDP